ncbi:hypothetical protein K493DRAFT_308699 [Basidiobolus meristosporus CBS 931.73]|uniref:Uncharacterized protein n=1 Tax=Basidiobolus meristosporus CBS 931.73 TaxID=1314790 RepID=A0A1Y1WZI4_9FUNG|nr:hypothetical protein K493DRAFT_308699 [Basidiobolus meristosporus CBS 931.73]|eukprot:ORX78504.1 hypothetical protein K493DRAFT_308699 [Basidiobolus meristosporus CBS 931.73]
MEFEIQKLFAELESDITERFNQCILHICNAKNAILAKQEYNPDKSAKSCKCIAIITTGHNKGSKCGRKVKQDSEYCGYHISKVAQTYVALIEHYLYTEEELQSVINTNSQNLQKNLQEERLSDDKCDDKTNLSSDEPIAETNISSCHKLGLGNIFSSLKNPSLEKNISAVDGSGLERNIPTVDESNINISTVDRSGLEENISTIEKSTLKENIYITEKQPLNINISLTKEPTLETNILFADEPKSDKSLYITYEQTLDDTFFSDGDSTLGKNSFVDGEFSPKETNMDLLNKAMTDIGEIYSNSDGIISVVKDTIIPYTWKAFRGALKKHYNI